VFDYDELTIDHVVPRMLGGKSVWENCVTACKSCNHSKGSHTHIKPRIRPYRPDYYSLVNQWKKMDFSVKQASWNQYLGLDKQVA
jgi:5-methylcytosine-specific restriction endonuclease McrA